MNIDGVVETGADERPIVPAVVIAKRSGHKIGVNPYVQKFVYHPQMNNADEISFTVDKYWNGELNPMWDEIKTFRLVYIPHYDSWFQIEVTMDDDDATTKSVTGTHLQEAELSQLNLYLNINDDTDRLKDDYKPTKFYQPNDKAHSLLDRMLSDKANYYSIFHVDASLYQDQREYTFDGKSIKDALSEIAEQVDCLFLFGESDKDDGKIHRTISAYDLEDYCLDCGERGNFPDGKCTKCGSSNIKPGYGHDTTIYIDKDNLADSITYETNADKVKNCFHLEAGDDAMTAAVRNCNPDGTNYLWYLSDAMKAEMSDELQEKLKQYDNTYSTVTSQNETAFITEDDINKYNAEVDKYTTLNKELTKITYPIVGHTALVDAEYLVLELYDYLKTTMGPNTPETQATTAQDQAIILESAGLSPIGVSNVKTLTAKFAEYVIKETCALYVDTALYKVTVNTTSFDSTSKAWTGTITLTSYVTADDATQERDQATTESLSITFSDATPDYVKTKIEGQLTRYKTNGVGIVALFSEDTESFKKDLQYYSLDNLGIIASTCQSVLDVLTDLGFGGDDEKNKKWHDEYYTPYYNKLGYINQEIATRESEVYWLKKDDSRKDQEDGLFDILEKERSRIRTSLDLRTFLGDDLWAELNSFRRDDEYHNENFISDDLNQHEIIENAMKFYKEAQKEIVKSATLQHTISADLYDLLIMPEFYPLLDNFKLGNWIHLGIDGEVYKLRMIGYEVDFDDISKLQIEFSDVINGLGTVEDLQSILNQATSMATSYNAVTRKANRGNQANSLITGMVQNGLDLTNRKIVNSADDQEVVQDEHGLLFRTRNEYGTGYNGQQTKIINSGLYYTNDGWETVKTGVGHFEYYDPEAQVYRDGYGVIADTLVGNLILGNGIGIYNTSNTFKADEDGVTITGQEGADASQMIFRIRRKNNDGTYTNYFTVSKNGDLRITGNTVVMSGGQSLERYIEDKVGEVSGSLNVILSNDFDGIVTDENGKGGNFTNCYCTVSVYIGGTNVTNDSSTAYTVEQSEGVVGTWDLTSHTYTVTNMTVDRGEVSFTVKYGDQAEITRIFTVKKIKNVGVVRFCDIVGGTAFKYDGDGNTLGESSIVLSAQMNNCYPLEWQYLRSDGIWKTYPGSTARSEKLTVNNTDDVFVNDIATIKLTTTDEEDSEDEDTKVYDIHTIIKLYDKSSSETIDAVLSDSFALVPFDSDGNGNFTYATSRITIYQGGVDVTADYTITQTATNCEIVSSKATADNDTVSVTAMSDDTASVVFTATKGTTSISKTFKLAKITRASMTYYMLEADPESLRKDESGEIYPASTTFSAYVVTIASDGTISKKPYNGRIAIYEDVEEPVETREIYAETGEQLITEDDVWMKLETDTYVDGELTYLYYSSEDENSHVYIPKSNATRILGVLYESGKEYDKSLDGMLDYQTVIITSDGENKYRAYITPQSVTFRGDTDAALEGENVTITPIIYKGVKQETAIIENIDGVPEGMSASIADNKKSATLTIVQKGTVVEGGTLTVNLSTESAVFTVAFPYSVALSNGGVLRNELTANTSMVYRHWDKRLTPKPVIFTAYSVTAKERYPYNGVIRVEITRDGKTWETLTITTKGSILTEDGAFIGCEEDEDIHVYREDTMPYDLYLNEADDTILGIRGRLYPPGTTDITDDTDYLDEKIITILPVGIMERKTQYYLSEQRWNMSGGTWQDTAPNYNPFTETGGEITKSFWKRTVTTYEDGEVVISNPSLAEDLNYTLTTTDNLDQDAMLMKLSKGKEGVFQSEQGHYYINATYIKAGSITADKLKAHSITSDYISVNSLDAISANLGTITAGVLRSSNGNTEINLNTGASTFKNNIVVDAPNFKIQSNGNVSMTGSITATSGSIGGFTIGNTRLYGGNVYISGSGWGAYSYAFAAGSNFAVTTGGHLYAYDATVETLIISTGGEIGYVSGSTATQYTDGVGIKYGDHMVVATSGGVRMSTPKAELSSDASTNNFSIKGDLNIQGGLYVRDVNAGDSYKSKTVMTEDYGERTLYCYETPTPMFGDSGQGVIGDDGYSYINTEPVFAQTIDESQYSVFLQSVGEQQCQLYEKHSTYFIVKGIPGTTFFWEIKAKQIRNRGQRLNVFDVGPNMPINDFAEQATAHISEINKGRITE